jgi:cytochrome d ubiquinol oxidase subunit II
MESNRKKRGIDMIDYGILRIIWWALLGILLIGFAIMDGFDLGVSALLPFLARNDSERRIMINSVGPVWEGNQVWIILGAGAIFAAWPAIYAVSFSGFYIAMFLVLLTFILRPVCFKYRSKLSNPRWRSTWDYLLSIAGILTCVFFGVAVGNVLQGVPFHFDAELRSFYTGTFWQLLNPFGLYCGFLSLMMLIMQGAIYLSNKSQDVIRKRATTTTQITGLMTLTLFIVAGFWVKHLIGYRLISNTAFDGPSNPLYKSATQEVGAWLSNYATHPYCLIAPILGVAGIVLALLFIRKLPKIAIIFSSIGILGIISTVGVSMFPFILPSSTEPAMSLIVWDASSSQLTLFIMLVVTLVFMPIILIYTAWVYRIMRGIVTEQSIADNHQSY